MIESSEEVASSKTRIGDPLRTALAMEGLVTQAILFAFLSSKENIAFPVGQIKYPSSGRALFFSVRSNDCKFLSLEPLNPALNITIHIASRTGKKIRNRWV